MSSLQHASPQPQPQQSSFSFTQGFLLGQLSVVIFIGAFIKFFIFGEAPTPESTFSTRALARRTHRRSISLNSSTSSPNKLKSKRSSHVLRNPPRLTTATILSKTYYNVDSHPPESLDWFNVLIAQTLAQFRTDAHDDDAILTSLTSVLNGAQKPDFLSDIRVTEISLGEEFPILSNCRIHPIPNDDSADGPRLQARMDVDLSDFITLGIETKILLNYPKPLTAVLPVALAVSVVRFSGTLSMSFLPSSSHPAPPANATTSSDPQQQQQQQQQPSPPPLPPSTTPTTLAFSFLPDYRLDLSIRSLVGSRSRLQDIPKIAQLVESRLHAWIDERCVEPRVQQVVLPSLWPRKKNTRGPESADGETEQAERDVREEARREVEEERAEAEAELERGGRRAGFEEGLRLRNREFDVPRGMPGGMLN